MIPQSIPRKRLFWAAALGHLTNDTFTSMGPVLLAFLSVSILPLTNTQVGFMVSASQMMGALTQPGFGLLADRSGGRWLGAGGVTWTVAFFMAALVCAQTGYFWLLFFPFVFYTAGSAAFHPVGSMHAANSDRHHHASVMTYFFLMGQLGSALGPLLAGLLLDLANPNTQHYYMLPFHEIYDYSVIWWAKVTPIFWLLLPAIPVIGFMLLAFPNTARYRAEYPRARAASAGTSGNGVSRPVKAFLVLAVMVALRSLAQPGLVAFFPVLFRNKGWSPGEYGAITGMYWISAGIVGLTFGNIADRVDRRWVIAIGMFLAAPALFLLPVADGRAAFLLAMAAGGLTGGSHSLIVVEAQDLMPQSRGFASGSILGYIFAMGALGSLFIGVMSDGIGLNATFQIVAGVIVVAGMLALLLPAHKPATAAA